MPCQRGPGPGPGPITLLRERGVEPRSIDPDAVLGGQLDRQVDRKAEGIVELEGDLAGNAWDIGSQIFRTEPDDTLAAGQASERFLEDVRAGFERPAELRLLPGDRGQDLRPPLVQIWVGVGHRVDHDRGGLDHERFQTAEQPTMPDGAPQDPPEHVAATLVRRKHAVGDEERHRPRVVSDDLVAEALCLEVVRVVRQQIAHPGVDRRKKVRVVVRRDLLEDAGEPLEAQAGVHSGGGQRRQGSIEGELELHEHEIPDLQPARAMLRVVGRTEVTLAELLAAVEMDLRARPRRAGISHPPEVLLVSVLPVAPAGDALRRLPRSRCVFRRHAGSAGSRPPGSSSAFRHRSGRP